MILNYTFYINLEQTVTDDQNKFAKQIQSCKKFLFPWLHMVNHWNLHQFSYILEEKIRVSDRDTINTIILLLLFCVFSSRQHLWKIDDNNLKLTTHIKNKWNFCGKFHRIDGNRTAIEFPRGNSSVQSAKGQNNFCVNRYIIVFSNWFVWRLFLSRHFMGKFWNQLIRQARIKV